MKQDIYPRFKKSDFYKHSIIAELEGKSYFSEGLELSEACIQVKILMLLFSDFQTLLINAIYLACMLDQTVVFLHAMIKKQQPQCVMFVTQLAALRASLGRSTI